jgi:hypothetical protein
MAKPPKSEDLKSAETVTMEPALAPAVAPQIKPASEPADKPDMPVVKRSATVASTIDHDGELYQPGASILLTRPAFEALAGTAALEERSWDDLSET